MKLVVLGGCTHGVEQGCLRCIEVLDVDALENDDAAEFELFEDVLVEPRRGAAVMADAEGIVIAGGCSGPGRHLSSVEKVQLKDSRWQSESVNDRVHEESCGAFCEYEDGLLIAGGFDGVQCLPDVTHLPASLSSSTFAKLPTRLKNAAMLPNPFEPDSLLLFGGWDESRTLQAVFRLQLRPSLELSVERVMPKSLEGHTATQIGDSIFIVGGYDGISPVPNILRFTRDTCHAVEAHLETPRENHAAVFLRRSRQLLVLGGWNGEALASVERFRVPEDECQALVPLPPLTLRRARQKAVAVLLV